MKSNKTAEDERIDDLEQERKALRQTTSMSDTEKTRYNVLHKEVRERRRKRARRRKIANVIRLVEKGKGIKHEIQEKKKKKISAMRSKDGTITSERGEILNICADFYQDLYSSKKQIDSLKVYSNIDDVLPVLSTEVKNASKQMKNQKAPDLDSIISDLLKIAGESAVNEITELFNLILIQKNTIQMERN